MNVMVGIMGKTNMSRGGQALSREERRYLSYGQSQPGGKLPLFDENGQEIKAKIIRDCVSKGLAEPWFANPMKPDWLVCRLTEAGRQAIS